VRDFYERFYSVVGTSPAHALFCERAFGRNLAQHGFADMVQLQMVVDVTCLGPADHVLDLGCGSGLIAEYLSDRTGARVTGLDYIPEAVRQAGERTAGKAERLSFRVGDINELDLPARSFDLVLSIDTLYFSRDYARTIGRLSEVLRPGGRMAFLFSYGWEPGMPVDGFSIDTLAPDRSPLAEALAANSLSYRTWDLTEADCRLAGLRRQVLEELRPRFEAEAIRFIYDNRMGECAGILQGCDLGLHRRALYFAGPVT